MLIVSQDRKRVTDDLNLYIIRDDDNFVIENTSYYLGKYKSEERAKEVLQSFLDFYKIKAEMSFEEGLLTILARNIAIFYMPEK